MTSEEFTNGHPALARFWHPVALSSEVGREPVAGRLGGRGWALARFGGGIAAFADACPHRRARLSAGQITDGTLQCPYQASVVISGLWLAAVTTGSMAIPCMLPIPDAGTMAQSVPMVAADSVIDSDGDAAACCEVAGVALAGLAAPVVLVVLAQPAAAAKAQASTGTVTARPRARRVSVHRIVLSWCPKLRKSAEGPLASRSQ